MTQCVKPSALDRAERLALDRLADMTGENSRVGRRLSARRDTTSHAHAPGPASLPDPVAFAVAVGMMAQGARFQLCTAATGCPGHWYEAWQLAAVGRSERVVVLALAA